MTLVYQHEIPVSVFNVIQERMIKGGYARITANGRNSTTRGMTNATRNVEFNKELWGILENFRPKTYPSNFIPR